jgi:hypothetical protein
LWKIVICFCFFVGNLAWHYPLIKKEIPERYHEYFWSSFGASHVQRDPSLIGGLVPLLCSQEGVLSDDELSVVLDCVHHFCYGKDGNSNKVEVVHHYYRILRQRCCELADSENGKGRKRSLKCRRSANGLICLLNIRKDDGEEK